MLLRGVFKISNRGAFVSSWRWTTTECCSQIMCLFVLKLFLWIICCVFKFNGEFLSMKSFNGVIIWSFVENGSLLPFQIPRILLMLRERQPNKPAQLACYQCSDASVPRKQAVIKCSVAFRILLELVGKRYRRWKAAEKKNLTSWQSSWRHLIKRLLPKHWGWRCLKPQRAFM